MARKKHHQIEEQDVLEALEEASYPLSLREVAREVGARGRQRRAVKKIVQKSHRIAEVKGGRYMPAHRKHTQEEKRKGAPSPKAAGQRAVTGRLIAHRDGYGFVIPDAPIPGMEGDIFIPPNALGEAMHGDRVRVRLREGRRGRGNGRVEGRIVGVERRAHPTLVGQFHATDRYNYVDPYEERIHQHVLIPRGAEKPPGSNGVSARELDGAMVNVEITHYPTYGGELAKGKVVEILGRPGDFGLDVEIIIRKYHLPYQFPDEVLAEARRVPPEPAPREVERRRDFRHLPIVTIDGEDAKDFDDAVYVERRPNGNYLLHVHIADVSHYVRPASELDREARLRGTSVYFPDRAVPMLPEELSNGICSLKPQEDRLVMSCLMEIDPQGSVLHHELAPGIIRSAARMTYTAVNAALEGDPEARARHPQLLAEFEKMRELARILNARRERRGSIDFDLPEPLIHFDEHGQMIGITRSERNVAHRLIEEFMLAANETVARHLTDRRIASLYRIHEEPDPQKVLEFEEIAARFGYSLGLAEQVIRRVRVHDRGGRRGRRRVQMQEVPERLNLSPKHYQRLTEKIAGRPEERILSYLMLRSLKQARYSEQNAGHFALATRCYTHFTSPIRRYPDLIVHRLVKWSLENHPTERQRKQPPRPGSRKKDSPEERLLGPLHSEELLAIGAESSEAERRANDAERELIELKKLDFMEQHLGDEFDGLVINVAKFGFWVELLELFVEGLVPLETLDPGADYYYREATRSITPGRRSQVPDAPAIRLGDRVRVRVGRIDRFHKKLQFSVVESKASP